MRLTFTTLFVLMFLSVAAQERTISGRLTSTEDGSPLPGINILIKGTTIGTTTDADGNYSIRVQVGSTLVFSFVGMQSRELLVTEDNLKPVTATENTPGKTRGTSRKHSSSFSRSLYLDSIPSNENGVVTLTDETSTYINHSNFDPNTIRSIKKTGNRYTIKTNQDLEKRTGFGLQVSTSLGIERINRLPSFQSTFAQGHSGAGGLQWAGADQQEIFSWGPQLKTLEFDGTPYPFDKNGKLVPLGSGNSLRSKNYDALTFFKTGWSNASEILLTLPGPKRSTIVTDFEHRQRSGIIPNSEYQKINFGTSLRSLRLSENTSANVAVSYNRSTGTLLSRGSNLASIVGSVYRTPVSFDNSNGLSRKSARSGITTYQLADGTNRSHAPGLVDNPFGLSNQLPDREDGHRLMSSVNINYNPSRPFSIVLNNNIDRQWSQTISGTPPGYAAFPMGRLTNRSEQETFVNAIITPGYRFNFHDSELKVSMAYQLQYTDRTIGRRDELNFSQGPFTESKGDSLVTLNKNLHRLSHEIIGNGQYEYQQWLKLTVSSRSYFSSTVNNSDFTNFFPSGSISISLPEVIYLWPVEQLKVYTTASRTIREAPLLYSNWSYATTQIPISSYAGFFESGELLFNNGLSPETERKFETGLKFEAFNNRLRINAAYYSNLTENFIAPAAIDQQFSLSNLATIKNYGVTIAAGHTFYSYTGKVSFGTDFTWTKHTSVVTELTSSEQWIALAGFETVQSVIAKGKPLGAIYGTTFSRNSYGEKIIGDDGFPVEDANLKMIGSPIPDWVLGWSAFARLKHFKVSWLFDFKKGGDMWNGTNSVLDYLGRSHTSGQQRNTNNYIFDGVNRNDSPNITPVTFSDPAKPVEENRWARYGWDGIAEEYIEDASWIRLSELALSYSIRPHQTRIKEFRFSLIGRNLFLITPYKGVDPASTLFGYATGNGLDLFNGPSTRSYGVQIAIKL